MASRRSRIQVRPNLGRGTPGVIPARTKKPDATTDISGSSEGIVDDKPVQPPVPITPIVSPPTLQIQEAIKSDQLDTGKKSDQPGPGGNVDQSEIPIPATPSATAAPVSIETPPPVKPPPPASKPETHTVVKPSTISRRSRIKPQVKIRPGKSSTGTPALEKPTNNDQGKKTGEKSDVHPAENDKSVDKNILRKPEITQDLTVNASTESDKPNSVQDVSSVTPKEQSASEKDVTVSVASEANANHELMKSPTKRSRFTKVKPNFLEAERRRQRLSSLSESEDVVTPRRTPIRVIVPSDHSEKEGVASGAEQKSFDDHTTPTIFIKPINEEKIEEKPKIKRRQSIQLEGLVSENRSKITISDLIHMNPTCNPMKRYLTNEKKKDETEVADTIVPDPTTVDALSPGPQTASVLGSPRPDDDDDDAVEEPMAVPQVMIGADGQIVLNDASLVIDNPAIQADPAVIESDIVVDNDNYNPSFYYKSRKRSSFWDVKETTKFYVALSTVGTDFSLMVNLFPKRNRTELKRKFKQEEKKHKMLVDKALSERRTLDMSIFDASSDEDKSPSEDQENRPGDLIQKKVKETLQKEKKGRPRKRKEKTINLSAGELVQPDPSDKAKASKVKKTSKSGKKKRRGKSRYYAQSSSEESDHDGAKWSKAVVNSDESGSDAAGSDEDDSRLDLGADGTTRSGRQPKRTKTFTINDDVKRRKRYSADVPNQPPANGVSHEVLEDKTTGQRLLLVKSPPPVGNTGQKHGKNDFVHVYLMSPTGLRRQTSESRDVPSPLPNVHDSGEAFVPPSIASPPPAILHEEIITDDVQIVDLEPQLTQAKAIAHCSRNSPQPSVSGSQYVHYRIQSPEPQKLQQITTCSQLPWYPECESPTSASKSLARPQHNLILSSTTPASTSLARPQHISIIQSTTPPNTQSPSTSCTTPPNTQSPSTSYTTPPNTQSPSTSYSPPHSISESVTPTQPEVSNPQTIAMDTSPSDSATLIKSEHESTTQDDTLEESQTYDNAEFLTITNKNGQIIEILIDPGLTDEDTEGNLCFDVQVTHPTEGGDPIVSLVKNDSEDENSAS